MVVRLHPDLVDALNVSADESGLSRSLYIERILVSWVRNDPRFADLDHMGRRREHPAPAAPASVRSFEQRWNAFAAMRRAAIGEDIPADDWPPLDDRGRPEDGSIVHHGRHAPFPHAKKPGRIIPHRGSRRKDLQKRARDE